MSNTFFSFSASQSPSSQEGLTSQITVPVPAVSPPSQKNSQAGSNQTSTKYIVSTHTSLTASPVKNEAFKLTRNKNGRRGRKAILIDNVAVSKSVAQRPSFSASKYTATAPLTSRKAPTTSTRELPITHSQVACKAVARKKDKKVDLASNSVSYSPNTTPSATRGSDTIGTSEKDPNPIRTPFSNDLDTPNVNLSSEVKSEQLATPSESKHETPSLQKSPLPSEMRHVASASLFQNDTPIAFELPPKMISLCNQSCFIASPKWCDSHIWAYEMLLEHEWVDAIHSKLKPSENDADFDTSDVLWKTFQNDSHCKFYQSAFDALFENFLNAKQIIPQPYRSMDSFSKYHFNYGDAFENLIDSSHSSSNLTIQTSDEPPNKKCRLDTESTPSTHSSHSVETLQDLLQIRKDHSNVEGPPSPLSPNPEFFDRQGRIGQEAWNWDRQHSLLGYIPPLCTCVNPEYFKSYFRTQTDGTQTSTGIEVQEEVPNSLFSLDKSITSPDSLDILSPLQDTRGNRYIGCGSSNASSSLTDIVKIPNVCPNRSCQGLLFVPYSFIEISLNRQIDSIIQFCKEVPVIPETEIYCGTMRHTVILVIRSPVHEILCLKALELKQLETFALIYDVDQDSFFPFHKPALPHVSKSQHNLAHAMSYTPTSPEPSSPQGLNDSRLKSRRMKGERISSFSYDRRPLLLNRRDISTFSRKSITSHAKFQLDPLVNDDVNTFKDEKKRVKHSHAFPHDKTLEEIMQGNLIDENTEIPSEALWEMCVNIPLQNFIAQQGQSQTVNTSTSHSTSHGSTLEKLEVHNLTDAPSSSVVPPVSDKPTYPDYSEGISLSRKKHLPTAKTQIAAESESATYRTTSTASSKPLPTSLPISHVEEKRTLDSHLHQSREFSSMKEKFDVKAADTLNAPLPPEGFVPKSILNKGKDSAPSGDKASLDTAISSRPATSSRNQEHSKLHLKDSSRNSQYSSHSSVPNYRQSSDTPQPHQCLLCHADDHLIDDGCKKAWAKEVLCLRCGGFRLDRYRESHTRSICESINQNFYQDSLELRCDASRSKFIKSPENPITYFFIYLDAPLPEFLEGAPMDICNDKWIVQSAACPRMHWPSHKMNRVSTHYGRSNSDDWNKKSSSRNYSPSSPRTGSYSTHREQPSFGRSRNRSFEYHDMENEKSSKSGSHSHSRTQNANDYAIRS